MQKRRGRRITEARGLFPGLPVNFKHKRFTANGKIKVKFRLKYSEKTEREKKNKAISGVFPSSDVELPVLREKRPENG